MGLQLHIKHSSEEELKSKWHPIEHRDRVMDAPAGSVGDKVVIIDFMTIWPALAGVRALATIEDFSRIVLEKLLYKYFHDQDVSVIVLCCDYQSRILDRASSKHNTQHERAAKAKADPKKSALPYTAGCSVDDTGVVFEGEAVGQAFAIKQMFDSRHLRHAVLTRVRGWLLKLFREPNTTMLMRDGLRVVIDLSDDEGVFEFTNVAGTEPPNQYAVYHHVHEFAEADNAVLVHMKRELERGNVKLLVFSTVDTDLFAMGLWAVTYWLDREKVPVLPQINWIHLNNGRWCDLSGVFRALTAEFTVPLFCIVALVCGNDHVEGLSLMLMDREDHRYVWLRAFVRVYGLKLSTLCYERVIKCMVYGVNSAYLMQRIVPALVGGKRNAIPPEAYEDPDFKDYVVQWPELDLDPTEEKYEKHIDACYDLIKQHGLDRSHHIRSGSPEDRARALKQVLVNYRYWYLCTPNGSYPTRWFQGKTDVLHPSRWIHCLPAAFSGTFGGVDFDIGPDVDGVVDGLENVIAGAAPTIEKEEVQVQGRVGDRAVQIEGRMHRSELFHRIAQELLTPVRFWPDPEYKQIEVREEKRPREPEPPAPPRESVLDLLTRPIEEEEEPPAKRARVEDGPAHSDAAGNVPGAGPARVFGAAPVPCEFDDDV